MNFRFRGKSEADMAVMTEFGPIAVTGRIAIPQRTTLLAVSYNYDVLSEVTLLWNAGPSSFQDTEDWASGCCPRDRRARQ